MDCSICGLEIVPEPIGGWDQGNNAAPVNDGRCCNECNARVVIPRRLVDAIVCNRNKGKENVNETGNGN